MPTTKKLGHKAVFKLNGTAIGAVKKFKPPELKREKVNVTTLDDNIEDYLDSEPIDMGEFSLEVYWQPNEAGNEAFETLIKNATAASRVATFVIEYPFTPAITDTFSGRILTLSPNDIVSKEGISRTITGVLTSTIVRAAAT